MESGRIDREKCPVCSSPGTAVVGRLDELFDEGDQIATAHRASMLADDNAILIDEQGRNATNAVFISYILTFIDVVLGNHSATGISFSSCLKVRGKHTAGATPGSPKVYDNRLVGNILNGVLELASLTAMMFSLITTKSFLR